ncbi:MarR family winged helix-turn-helix transcriptional regulator [Oceanicella actignis]|uniref:MarR family winged helix-turn-helix transcriptional regulator n=1 Tax=Oceanicella actignis TaxID=1189325 RepID=UPI0011E802FB|nr:MarR family transcriptional regulator [Oceanicella actignis]TYO88479.1 DNA-binding MarR family transcriptional regulator [Oceanicella actignis]
MEAKDVNPRSLGFLITDVARLLRADLERRVARAGLALTSGEARALVHAAAAEGARQTHLAERMGVEPMTLCGYVDRLESQGLVARQPHPQDGRAKIVTLTPQGREMIREIAPLLVAMLADATEGMSQAQIDALRAALEHMRARLTSDEG